MAQPRRYLNDLDACFVPRPACAGRACRGHARRASHDGRSKRSPFRALDLSACGRLRVALVLGAVFSSSLGVGLIFGFQPPLIALTLSRAGASSFAIGAVTSASLIAVILLGPWYPRVIARLGLKRCIVAGVCIAAVILLFMPVWPGVPSWLLLAIHERLCARADLDRQRDLDEQRERRRVARHHHGNLRHRLFDRNHRRSRPSGIHRDVAAGAPSSSVPCAWC